jgi:stress response protein YsnF
MTQTITAMYDNQSDAQAAMSKLIASGIPQSSIRLTAGSSTTAKQSSGSYDHTRDEGGFWASLKDAFMPEEDRYTYSEGLSRGGTLLTVSADGAHVDTSMNILEEHGSVDLDEREATWRKEGWSGYQAGAAGGATATTGALRNPTTTEVAGGTTATRAAGATEAVAAHGAAQTGTDYIPVVEERLNVGKRMVESGRVRVRSYAVEEAVSENVTLHDETVQVDRRVVDRAVTPGDEALFAEKVIEATEMREQAVVSKDARVVGEVGIRKDATQRTETVSDKVRRTEVEVEDERGNISRTGTTDKTKPVR